MRRFWTKSHSATPRTDFSPSLVSQPTNSCSAGISRIGLWRPTMLKHPLDFNTRKALCIHLGESAGRAIADLVFNLAARVEAMERNKVDVTRIVRDSNSGSPELMVPQ